VTRTFVHPTVTVSANDPYVRALRDAVSRSTQGEVMSVGRDGASDAAAFIEAGIPAVEFGPTGAGHHGPEEWVSISSLARYRRALADFVRAVPMWLESKQSTAVQPTAPSEATGNVRAQETSGLRAIEGGRA
jgi:succinyl-diaminopimelate desuccinylase